MNDNNMNNVDTVSTPPKKKHTGLIVGIIVAVFVVLIGGIVGFLVFLKPMLDNGSSSGSNEEEKEELTWTEIYTKYFKKNLEDDYSLALIDLNDDDVPEAIVKESYKSKSIYTIKNDKVKEISLPDSGEFDLLYNIEDDKEEWYYIDLTFGSGYEFNKKNAYYNVNDIIKKLELTSPELYSSSEANKKFVSLGANIHYDLTDEDSVSKTIKSLSKSLDDNYTVLKTSKEAKKEYENKYTGTTTLSCVSEETDNGSFSSAISYDFIYINGRLNNINLGFDLKFQSSLDENSINNMINAMKNSLGSDYSFDVQKIDNSHYKMIANVSAETFAKSQGISFDSSDFDVSTIETMKDTMERSGDTSCVVK